MRANGFIHIAMHGHWRDLVTEQFEKMHSSGLWERMDRLHVGLLGPDRSAIDEFLDPKIDVLFHHVEYENYEFPTLNALRQFSHENDGYVFYLHTKGVFRNTTEVADWRHLMEYFVIERYEECITSLGSNDVCGVNWLEQPWTHFSGNFWWARTDYIRRLPPIVDIPVDQVLDHTERHRCERWIGSGRPLRVNCLHSSNGVDHYIECYPRERYAGRILNHVPSAWKGLENRIHELLSRVGSVRRIVEIGVDHGFSLIAFASRYPSASVIGIDPYDSVDQNEKDRLIGLGWRGFSDSREAMENAERGIQQFSNAMLWKMTSLEAAERFHGQIDVLHIDAVHTYDDVRADFEAWEPFVRPGGCVLFHDTRSFPEDVGRFFGELPGEKAEISESCGLGAWYKPEVSS